MILISWLNSLDPCLWDSFLGSWLLVIIKVIIYSRWQSGIIWMAQPLPCSQKEVLKDSTWSHSEVIVVLDYLLLQLQNLAQVFLKLATTCQMERGYLPPSSLSPWHTSWQKGAPTRSLAGGRGRALSRDVSKIRESGQPPSLWPWERSYLSSSFCENFVLLIRKAELQ